MSVLPRSIPAKFTEQLRAALADGGVAFDGSIKPGTRITHAVAHQGVTWELRYALQVGGEPVWKLTGPGAAYEWGPAATTAEAVAAITAPLPAPEPEPEPDPFPGVPKTYVGVDVPLLVRETWVSVLGDGWRLGVRSATAR